MGAFVTPQQYLDAVRQGFPGDLVTRIGKSDRFSKTDDLAAFLARELEATAVKVMQVPLTDLPLINGSVISVNATTVPEGADSFTYVLEDGSGQARWYDDYASGSIPMVEVSAQEFRVTIQEFALGWRVTTKDMRNSAFAGRGDLNSKLANRAIRGMNEFAEAVGMYGDLSRNVFGMANHPNVPVLPPTYDPGVSSSAWSVKGGDYIQADIVALDQATMDSTHGNLSIDRLFIPLRTWTSMRRVYVTSTGTSVSINSQTVLQFIQSQNPQITFAPLLRLQSDRSQAPMLTPNAPATRQLAADRVVAMANSPDVLEFIQPITPRFGTPQWIDLRLSNPGYSTTGGTVMYQPFGVGYMDVSAAAA